MRLQTHHFGVGADAEGAVRQRAVVEEIYQDDVPARVRKVGHPPAHTGGEQVSSLHPGTSQHPLTIWEPH